ncbi:hypothetical protein F4Y59_11190 [Candidatus Poribacteria bacterium]|nr:hypothetical protein [Candidatus Poribacteria bacterium]
MSLLSRPILPNLFLFLTRMLVLNLLVYPTYAVDHDVESRTPNPIAAESIAEAQKSALRTTSSHTFSFQDVYQINLNLNIPGDIECVATEGDTITVALEKQTQATHTGHDLAIRSYLDNISVTGTKDNGTLQLKVQLPGDDDTQAAPIPFSSIENLPVTFGGHLRLRCTIKTPSDVSVKLQSKAGEIQLQGIRGEIEIKTETGNVHLNETLGNYNVNLTSGNIKGKILLTRGQNKLETKNGAVELTILDPVAAPMDITAQGGNILLQLPEDYAIDALLESEKQQVVINLPAQIESDTPLAIINDGGPLFRLKATQGISLLQSMPTGDQGNAQADTEPASLLDAAHPVPRTEKPPVVDGNLSELVWQAASALSVFQNAEGTEASNDLTETFLMWDDQNLYIGVIAHIPNSQLPRVSQTQRDSPIWEDECIEILIDANPRTDVYHHLVINPIGALFDQQVSKPGEASFQFAPSDVQLALDQQALKTTFEGDRAWSSDAEVATQINATSWSLEIAIPRETLEKPAQINLQNSSELKDISLFNIHRKAQLITKDTENFVSTTQREYSYWLPTYYDEHPWWPHLPHEYTAPLSEYIAPAMGVLRFERRSPFPSETFATEEQFRVATIEIEGNTLIPTEVVQQQIPVRAGDVITSTQLSWLLAEMRNRDMFQDVRLETKQLIADDAASERSATIGLLIKITEAPVVFARQIQIDGNRTFPTAFIKRWFQLESGYLALDVVKRKQQLIADFYLNRGYEFATVTYRHIDDVLAFDHESATVTRQYLDDVLTFTINEGTLHEVRFTGNHQISREELLKALNIETADADEKPNSPTPDVYHRSLGQSKINQMRRQLNANNEDFKSIQNWRVQREGGKNIMIVEIEEQPRASTSGFPILQFNRVHGLVLGAGGTLATRLTTQRVGKEQLFGALSRGFSSKTWDYHAGLEKSFFSRQSLKVGASVYKLTGISSNAALSSGNVNLSAAYYGFDLQDYYRRQGVQGWITYAASEWHYLRLELTTEAHDNLSKSTDWSYLNRNQVKRGNARIDSGVLEGVALIYAFDTRDHKSTTRRHFHTYFSANERTQRGWRGQVGIEIARGDYPFNLYQFELIRYTRLFGPHHLHVRVGGDFSDAPLPTQRLLHLGGGANLRGYGFNRFAGDNRLLLNLEYRFMKEVTFPESDAVLGWTLSCFLDSGRAWWYDDVAFPDFGEFTAQFNTAIGVGCSVFMDSSGGLGPLSIALEVAEPLSASFSLRNPQIILRLDRIF